MLSLTSRNLHLLGGDCHERDWHPNNAFLKLLDRNRWMCVADRQSTLFLGFPSMPLTEFAISLRGFEYQSLAPSACNHLPYLSCSLWRSRRRWADSPGFAHCRCCRSLCRCCRSSCRCCRSSVFIKRQVKSKYSASTATSAATPVLKNIARDGQDGAR